MRDPFNTYDGNEKTLLYTQPQAVIGMGLAVHRPVTVWTGTIASAPTFPTDGRGVGQLAITTASGTFASVKEGMTVIIDYGAGGKNYYTYARKDSSGSTLYINGLGNGTVATSIGTPVKVLKEWLPWPRRIRFDSGDWKVNFDLAYTDENENFGPQAIMGPSAVIYKDGSVTFEFDGTRSKAWTPGESISAYLWTFPDATTSTSATPSWTTSTAYPDGDYVSLRVTESTTGKTHTGYRLLWKFDSTHKPKTDFEITELSGRYREGYTLGIRSSDVTLAAQDTGTNYYTAKNHVVLFGTTAYGSTVQNIGGNFPDRQNIYFDGWVMENSVEVMADRINYTYTCQTIDGLMALHGFAVALDDTASPASWMELANLDLDLLAFHWARWRTTATLVCDMHFAEITATESDKKFGDMAGGSLWSQLQSVYEWIPGGIVSVDAQGSIYCEHDAIVAGTVASLPQALGIFGEAQGIAERRWLVREGYEYADRPVYRLPVAKSTIYGVSYDIPVGSRSPDDPVQHGEALDEIAAGLHGTQAQMNVWNGNRQAQLNNPLGMRRFPLIGIIRIDPVPQCTVGIMTGNSPYVDPEYIWVVRGIEIEFDPENGMAYATIDCEQDIPYAAPVGRTIAFTSL